MVPPLSTLSLALYHEALEGGGSHKMKTIISQKETSPLDNQNAFSGGCICIMKPRSGNAHFTHQFEKTYRIINLRRYPPQSANETRKCAGTPNHYTTSSFEVHSDPVPYMKSIT